MNLNEYILHWCEKSYPEYALSVYGNMVDVAAGNREGTESEKHTIQKIFAEYENYKQTLSAEQKSL